MSWPLHKGFALCKKNKRLLAIFLKQIIIQFITGLGAAGLFICGNYSNTATVSLQVEAAKYENGINWLHNLLFKTKFTAERLKVIALKMNNAVAQAKRSGRSVASYAMKNLWYSEGKR